MNVRLRCLVVMSFLCFFTVNSALAQKPALTFDEFFNSISYDAVRLSPDGHSVVIGVVRADWEQNIFRRDLYLYREATQGESTLRQLTQSGHDGDPQWSPDGRWIAFLSEQKISTGKGRDDDADAKDKEVTQIYLISPDGGEAFPVTQGDEDAHGFAWSPDSKSLYYATRTPWTKTQKDAYKKDWKDVIEYRNAERGDEIFSLSLVDVLAGRETKGTKPAADSDETSRGTPGAQSLARSDFHIEQIAASPDGKRLAFNTSSISSREEIVGEFEIYSVDIAGASPDRAPRRLTRNEAQEGDIAWASDSRHVMRASLKPRACPCSRSSTVALPMSMAITLKPIGISGPVWRRPMAGSCLSPTIAAPPVTAISSSCRSFRKLSPARGKIFWRV